MEDDLVEGLGLKAWQALEKPRAGYRFVVKEGVGLLGVLTTGPR